MSETRANKTPLDMSQLTKLANLLNDKKQRTDGLGYLRELGGIIKLFDTVVFTPDLGQAEEEFCAIIKKIFSQFVGGFDYVFQHAKPRTHLIYESGQKAPETQPVTCLTHAVDNLAPFSLSRLLKMGANPNFRLPNGGTALFKCSAIHLEPDIPARQQMLVIRSVREMMQALAAYQADPNQFGITDTTPLYNLAGRQENACSRAQFEELLKFKNLDVNCKAADGQHPLYKAACAGNLNVIKALISAGAEINAVQSSHATALAGASIALHWDIARELLSNGADPNICMKMSLKNDITCEPSPLHIVIDKFHSAKTKSEKDKIINLVKLLLIKKADPYIIINNRSALSLVIVDDLKEIFECFVNQRIDFNAVCHTYNTSALMLAGKYGRFDMILRMAATGTDITALNVNQRSLLFYASGSGNIELVKHLIHPLRHLINQEDDLGYTPLYFASEKGQHQTVACLLKNGAKILPETTSYQTPLHAAAGKGHTEVARMLIAHATSQILNAQTKEGVTALFFAAQEGYFEIVKLLVEASADPELRHMNGGSAMYHAFARGHRQIAEYLFNKIYCEILFNSGMDIEYQLINSMIQDGDGKEICLRFTPRYNGTLYPPAPDLTTKQSGFVQNQDSSTVTDADIYSGFRFLREQGFSPEEIKQMKKPFQEPEESASSSSSEREMEEFTWMENKINSTSDEVMHIEGSHSGRSCFIYFDKIALAEQGCDFVNQLTKARCKFAAQDNAGGIIKLKGNGIKLDVEHDNDKTTRLITDEFKIIDKPSRVLCYRLNSDNNRATLFVACLYAPNGLHQTSDRARLNNKMTLHLPVVRKVGGLAPT